MCVSNTFISDPCLRSEVFLDTEIFESAISAIPSNELLERAFNAVGAKEFENLIALKKPLADYCTVVKGAPLKPYHNDTVAYARKELYVVSLLTSVSVM